MSEHVVRFGDGERLAGLVTRPDKIRAHAPAILLFNAGVVQCAGAHRLNVKIARRLAAAGFASLRFDLSGLGDSPPARGALGYEKQSVNDIMAALDCLEREAGDGAAVAIGMCSGADNAYRAAVSDTRLGGIVLLDPYAYETAGAALDRIADRAANPDRWVRKFKILTGREEKSDDPGAAPSGHGDPPGAIDEDRDAPPVEKFGADLQTITDRGGKILILYTSYVQEKVTRSSQFFHTFNGFDFGGRIDVKVLSHIDHTYTELAAQTELFEHLSSWLTAHWPA